MKTGKTLIELATEITRQAEAKQDYIANTRNLSMQVTAPAAGAALHGEPMPAPRVQLVMTNGHATAWDMEHRAHRQLGERIAIPIKYYDRMLTEAPRLLADNVNHWLYNTPETRMVRTLDGRARAFLSNSYQRIDNVHIANTVLPVLQGIPGLSFESMEITPSKLYIKAVTTEIAREVKSRRAGDIIQAGLMITNSEVGEGAVAVVPFFKFLACLNGLVMTKNGIRSAHLGTKIEGNETLAAILQDDTRQAIDRGILLKIRDVVRNALDETAFGATVDRIQGLTEREITGDPALTVQLLANDFGMTEREQGGVLEHLIRGGDLSQYGLLNAVTRTAEDIANYDRATEFETMGGRVLELPAKDWTRISTATRAEALAA